MLSALSSDSFVTCSVHLDYGVLIGYTALMSFSADIRQFRTAAEFAAYLATLAKPNWIAKGKRIGPVGSTAHNTYKPTEQQWNGRSTMFGMMEHYISLGWDSGPHVYLACHSPNPAHDGIWQMTPPTMPGTHAGSCNSTRFGVEVVGDFQSRPWSPKQYQLALETLTVLHRWAGIGPDINGHRDCMAGRTCPGDAAYAELPALRADLTKALKPTRMYQVIGVPIYQRSDGTGPLAGHLHDGDVVTIDATYPQGTGHLADGRGFIDLDALEAV